MAKRHYIAYGSNMSVEQMARRCPDAELIGTAVLEGWRLAFKGCATIEKRAGYRTPVLVWTISEGDERNLDHYEGFPSFYHKETIPVHMQDFGGHAVGLDAMAYIMDPDRKEAPPTEYYYGVIRDAYRVFGLDMGILETALKESREARNGEKE